VLIVQIPVFLALYSGLRGVVDNPQHIIDVSYPFVRDLSWMKELGSNISRFDHTLLGVVDLRRSALPTGGGIYFPAMLIVAASAVAQYFQSKQLLPTSKDGRNLRSILKDAGKGKNSDQAEVNAAVGRFSLYFIPGLIFIFTVNIASALSLYWLTSGAVALAQQAKILGQDEIEMEKIADEPTPKQVIEGEVIATKPKPTKKPSKSAKAKAKRRKK
jgi:membrane protein insertase Oxa1/YidC/SpoIIIJ